MAKAETLAEVKRVEDDVRRARDEASKKAALILKEARMKGDDVLAKAAEEADRFHKAEIDRARAAVKTERDGILREGNRDADTVRQNAAGPRLEKAAGAVVKRFSDKMRE